MAVYEIRFRAEGRPHLVYMPFDADPTTSDKAFTFLRLSKAFEGVESSSLKFRRRKDMAHKRASSFPRAIMFSYVRTCNCDERNETEHCPHFGGFLQDSLDFRTKSPRELSPYNEELRKNISSQLANFLYIGL